ncbi:MAG: DUF1989 domain-containing protein [Dehalococcoidia bacterium]|nr:DUF1989 domain-containing protein [Dehalococcoidia bacterium]
MKAVLENRIEPQTGVAFSLERGRTLRITDLEGEQVADLIAFSLADSAEWLSSGRSIDYAGTINFTTGHVLYSNRSTAMLTIVEDTVARHDFLFSPCSAEMFERLYGFDRGHPSCFSNLASALAQHGIDSDRIPTTFNVFMNIEMAADGRVDVRPPISKAGDHFAVRAEIDLIVGLTACSAEQSNNWRFKPIGYSIF